MNSRMVSLKTLTLNRWLFIPLGMAVNLCLGTVYSWSVFRKPLEDFFEIGATQSGLPFMLFLVFYAVLMPITGGFIDRFGPRLFMILGGFLVGVGWIISGYAKNITHLTLTYGVIAGSGVGISYGAPIATVSRWFPERKGFTVGLTLIGFGLSPFITAPLASWLISLYGPMYTFILLGFAFLIIIPTLGMLFKFPEGQALSNSMIKNNTEGLAQGIDSLEMLKSLKFYGLWVCFTAGTFIGLTSIGISSPVAIEVAKLDARTASFMISVFAVFNGIGRPLFGWLTEWLSPRWAAVVSFKLIALASVLMLVAGKGSILVYGLVFAILWLNLGGWLAIAPTATAIFFGLKNYSRNYGYVFTAYGMGAILGTIVSGLIRDAFGGYIFVFYPIIIVAITGLLVAYFLLK